jgi:hypothetical protein
MVVVPNFLQTQLGVDPVALHDDLTQIIPIYTANESLQRGVLKRVPGDHTFL